MPNYNKVLLMGNITRDIEVKYTPKGTAVTDIGLAINRFIPAAEGSEKREEVTFVDVTFWGRSAETLKQYCKKGRPLFVEGRLQLDTWDDKQTGQKRSRIRIVGENFQFIDSRAGGSGGGSGDYDVPPSHMSEPPPPTTSRMQGSTPSSAPDDDDIPF